jgi:hypothetical protein
MPAAIQTPLNPESKHSEGGTHFTYAINLGDEHLWPELLDGFADANLFQTVPFCSIKSPRSRVERFLMSKDSKMMAAALVRVISVPWPGVGCAYVRWGPLWRRTQAPPDLEVWRQAIRGLRAEYVLKRNMWLRLLPMLTDADDPAFVSAMNEEGFVPGGTGPRQRTMLIDLTPPLEQLRKGLDQKWRNHLNRGERNGLEIVEGTEDRLIEQFLVPYQEMISRKGLSEPGDIQSFRAIQRALPERQKMRVFLASSEGEVCTGAIASLLGERGIYHFGATGNKGMKTKAAYVLQWRIMQWLKQRNCTTYDLHGVNRASNPGVYEFKSGLCGKNGKEVTFVGSFDSCGGGRARMTAGAANLFAQRRTLLKSLFGRLLPGTPRTALHPVPNNLAQ